MMSQESKSHLSKGRDSAEVTLQSITHPRAQRFLPEKECETHAATQKNEHHVCHRPLDLGGRRAPRRQGSAPHQQVREKEVNPRKKKEKK